MQILTTPTVPSATPAGAATTSAPGAATAPSATPAPAVPFNAEPSVPAEAAGTPSWYGTSLGREERSWRTRTGDVDLLAGRTFPTTFHTINAALEHAQKASVGNAGALFILHPAHKGPYLLARSYNAEHHFGQGYVIEQSQFDGGEKFSGWNENVVAVVDGDVAIRVPHH